MKVKTENIDEEYQGIVKENMTKDEIAQLGVIIAKQKITNLKNKICWWKYDRKTKKQNKKKI